jgi:MoaA/NifB/PqqE/SkfB family radical SAM enzyme
MGAVSAVPESLPAAIASVPGQTNLSRLLRAGPVRQIRLDLTDRCNLRCTYCSVSSKNYQGADMAPQTISRAIDTIVKLGMYHNLEAVDLNGHGETTYLAGWANTIRPLLEHDVRVRLQSNFAKSYSDEELEALACMTTIGISIDSANREVLRDVRRHVDLKQIIANIVLVRSTAIRLLRRPPGFAFSCGLYDKSAPHVEELARLAVALDIKAVNFWNLHRHEHQDTELKEGDRVYPLDDLTDSALKPILEAILRAIRLLRSRGIQVHVRANFLNVLAKRVGINV